MDDGSNCIDRPPPVPGVFSGVALRRRHEKGNQHGITRCPAAFLRAAIHRRTLSSSLLPCFASREKPRSVECGVSAVLVVGMLDCLRAMNDEKIIDRTTPPPRGAIASTVQADARAVAGRCIPFRENEMTTTDGGDRDATPLRLHRTRACGALRTDHYRRHLLHRRPRGPVARDSPYSLDRNDHAIWLLPNDKTPTFRSHS